MARSGGKVGGGGRGGRRRKLGADDETFLPASGEDAGVESAPGLHAALPSVSDKQRFDISLVRQGVPLVRDMEVPEGVKEVYEQFPPAVLEQAEFMWVTGMGTSHEHIRMLVRHVMGLDVPEAVLKFHFSRHFGRLTEERKEFLRRRHERALEEQLEVCTNPTDGRFQAIALGMSTVLEGMVNQVLHGEREVDIGDLRQLAAAAKEIAQADPSYMRKARRDEAAHARTIAQESMEGMGEGLVRARKFAREEEAADRLVDEYQTHTERILDDGKGGGNDG